jgi:tetratricopeptide (TPR) repeat protein
LQKAGNRFGEATVLVQINYVYNQLGEKQKALDVLNQALVLWRAIPAPASEAFTLRNIADIHNSMGEPQQALDLYNQALDIQLRVEELTQEAVTLNSIAGVYQSLGDYQLRGRPKTTPHFRCRMPPIVAVLVKSRNVLSEKP